MKNKINKLEEQAKPPQTWGDVLNQTQEFLKNKLSDATQVPNTNAGPKPPSFNSGGSSGPKPATGAGGATGTGPRKPGGGTTPQTNTSIFDCLLKDPDLKLYKDIVKYVPNNPDEYWAFFSNNRFYSNSTKKRGTWSCNGADGYIIKLDDGSDEYSSKDGWKSKQNNNNNNNNNTNNNTNTNTTTLVDTNLTGDELKAGKVVKIGMKGPIVGTIQDLLIKLGYTDVSSSGKADNKFGKRTQKMVKNFQTANGLNDDGEVGKDTWPKLNDPAAVKNTSSSSSGALGGAQAQVPQDGETTAGSDAIIIKESLRKTLRKNLLKFN